mgnify:CR=1 FL=1
MKVVQMQKKAEVKNFKKCIQALQNVRKHANLKNYMQIL